MAMLPLVFQTIALECRDLTLFDGILPDAPCGVGAGEDEKPTSASAVSLEKVVCCTSSCFTGSIYVKYSTMDLVGLSSTTFTRLMYAT
jgi:hypothetical protein